VVPGSDDEPYPFAGAAQCAVVGQHGGEAHVVPAGRQVNELGHAGGVAARDEATTFLRDVYQRADAFLFGRRTYERPRMAAPAALQRRDRVDAEAATLGERLLRETGGEAEALEQPAELCCRPPGPRPVRRPRRGVRPMPSVPRRSLRRRLSKARRRSGSHSSQQGRSSRGRSSRRRCDYPPESP
jgi:hypothetical protein